MKALKFLSIALIAISFSVSGQNAVQMRNIWGNYANDTVKGAVDTYVYIQSQKFIHPGSIQPVVAKYTAGTSPNRKFILEASNDGVNYKSIGTDTLTCHTTISQKVWVLEKLAYEYYRIHALANYTAGTPGADTLILNGWVVARSNGSNTNTVVNSLSSYGLISDTVTNTATNTLVSKIAKSFDVVSVQSTITKISGTVGGTVTLQGSNDGVNFVTVNTGYVVNDVTTAPYTTGGSATYTPTNVTTNTYLWTLRNAPYQYIRVSYAGTGTMSASMKAFVLGNY